MSPREWKSILFKAQGCRCYYCGNFITENSLDVADRAEPDHLYPLCEQGCSCSGNVVAACGTCNRMKQGKKLIDFFAERPQFLKTAGEFSTRVFLLPRLPALFWDHLRVDLRKLSASTDMNPSRKRSA